MVALIGCFSKPTCRHRIISRDSLSSKVENPNFALRYSIALVCCFA
jgi:hypothetical protein